jgi:hypothetical protein
MQWQITFTHQKIIMNEGIVKVLVAQIHPMNFKCFRFDMQVELNP